MTITRIGFFLCLAVLCISCPLRTFIRKKTRLVPLKVIIIKIIIFVVMIVIKTINDNQLRCEKCTSMTLAKCPYSGKTE